MATPRLLAVRDEVECIVSAILRGDRDAAADIARGMDNPAAGVLVAGDIAAQMLGTLCRVVRDLGANDMDPADVWAAWLLHEAERRAGDGA